MANTSSTNSSTNRYVAVAVGVLAVVLITVGLVRCGSEENGSSTSVPSSTVDEPPTSATDTTTVDTTTASTTVSTTEITASTVPTPQPLVEPTVELIEIGSFARPVDIAVRPGDPQIFVAEQPGSVVALDGQTADVVLDITDLTSADGERGLLGLAFHPTEDLVYVDYTDNAGDTVVAEFAVDPATGAIDRGSMREVLTVDQPYANHNGGKLAFGPDELLYIALGDGGSRDDPQRHALDLSSRLGKILRIDPLASGDQPFTVPGDNPFVDTAGADPTIWAYGLRNPWRFSFDPDTGDLWIADVGQGDVEEINHAPATDGADAGRGLNFGWSAFEGLDRFNEDQPTDNTTPPVHVYRHDNGRCSVSGGTLARDTSVADLNGWYVFGDYCTGEIWAFDPSSTVDAPRVVELGQLPGVASIVPGPDGELYAVSNNGPIAVFSDGRP